VVQLSISPPNFSFVASSQSAKKYSAIAIHGQYESTLVLDEISEIKWLSPEELGAEFEQNRDSYCPWMAIALYFFADCDDATKEKFGGLIDSWTTDELQQVYQNAIKHYIPDDNWRLVE
jgi:hypothetical protein